MRLIAVPLLLAGGLLAAEPIVDSFTTRYKVIRLNMIESADVMPAEAMEFKLSPPQRPYAEWLTHTATMNYNVCASIAGQTAPANTAAAAHTKEEVKKALADSFAYCDGVFEGFTDARALTPATIGTRRVLPVDLMFGYLASLNEHYGNMVGYMRVKGLVPPSTARAARKK